VDELAKIDLIRERLGVTYREAKEALDQANGDVVQALIKLEERNKKRDGNLEEKVRELGDYIKGIIRKGNVTKVRLKKDDRTVFEIPATVGAIGVGGILLNPLLMVLGVAGTVAAFANHCKLEIVRPNGQVEEQDLHFLQDNDQQDD